MLNNLSCFAPVSVNFQPRGVCFKTSRLACNEKCRPRASLQDDMQYRFQKPVTEYKK